MNDRLIIKYDIAGNKPDDRFHVWLEITDSTGIKIAARSLYGDIGDEVTGGFQKQIIWDLAADSVYLNTDINIEIFATRIIKTPAEVAEKVLEVRPEMKTDSALAKRKMEKTPALKTDSAAQKKRDDRHPETKTDSVISRQKVEKQPETKTDTVLAAKKTEKEPEIKADAGTPATKKSAPDKKEKNLPDKSLKVGNNILLSTVCPGWGLTRLTGGKPYWLIGVAGYGCIASSYYLNRQSRSNYDSYKSISDITKTSEMDDYYNTGKKQYAASNVLAISAIAIWIADLGFTWIKASKMKRSVTGTRSGSFSAGSSFDYAANAPLISIYYTF